MKAEIVISDLASAEKLAAVLRPEIGEELSRTSVSMEVDDSGNSIKVLIEAEDVSSLRAAVNSFLRWLRIATETNDLIGEI